MEETTQYRISSQLLFGAALAIFGVMLLMDNFDIIEIGNVWHYWPFIIVAIGVKKILEAQTTRGRGEGYWLVFIGLWLFVSVAHVFGFSFRNSWPLILMGWGSYLVWRSLVFQSARYSTKEQHYGN